MRRPESEYDIQRPDNPNRLYTSMPIAYAIASIVNTIGKLRPFNDISAIVVKPIPGIGDPKHGLDIEGSDDHKRLVEGYVKRVLHRIDQFEEKEQIQKLEEYASKISLRGRRVFDRYQTIVEKIREKRKK